MHGRMVLEKMDNHSRSATCPTQTGHGQLLFAVNTCGFLPHRSHIVMRAAQSEYFRHLGHKLSAASSKSAKRRWILPTGDRVGIPMLGWTDGDGIYCRSTAKISATGQNLPVYTIDGGYAGSPGRRALLLYIYLPTDGVPRLFRCFAPACSATVLNRKTRRASLGIYGLGTRPI